MDEWLQAYNELEQQHFAAQAEVERLGGLLVMMVDTLKAAPAPTYDLTEWGEEYSLWWLHERQAALKEQGND